MPIRLFVIASLVSGIVYGLSLSVDSLSNPAAFAVTQALNLSASPTYTQPVWHFLISALDVLPGALSWKLHGFALVVAIVTCGFVCIVGWGMPHGLTAEERHSPVDPKRLRLLGALVSFALFAFTMPVWRGLTQPLPHAFGLCLMLGLIWITMVTFRKRSALLLNVVAVGWGAIVAEYTSAWLFAPGFALAVLFTGFTPQGHFRWKRNLRLLGLALLGFSLSLVTAYQLLRHPAADIHGVANFGEAFWDILRVQKRLITEAAPWRGGLAVALLVGGPFITVFIPKVTTSLQHRYSSHFLHLVCTVVVTIMFLHPEISPYGMLLSGRMGFLMLAPYAVLSLTAGYLVTYWYALSSRVDPFQPMWLQTIRKGVRSLYLPGIAVLLFVNFTWNMSLQHRGLQAAVAARVSGMAEALAGKDVYVGETGFNDYLRLQLRELGSDCSVIDTNPVLWGQKHFRQLMARKFPDRPHLAALAEVGLGPLLHAWILDNQRGADGETQQIIIGSFPELIQRSGLIPLPTEYGDEAVGGLSVSNLLDRQESLQFHWSMVSTNFVGALDSKWVDSRTRWSYSMALTEESRRANNMGFLLVKKEQYPVAADSFRSALRLNPDNVSALLNLSMLPQQWRDGEQESIQARIEELLENLGDRRFDHWRLAHIHGYLTHPRVHMERGLAFAVTGKAQMAVREYQQALANAPDSPLLKLRLAQAHALNDDAREAEKQYVDVLTDDPDNHVALLGLLRLEAMRGRPDQANSYLIRLENAGLHPEAVHRERVGILVLSGKYREAISLQEDWLEDHRGDITARLILAELALRVGDRALANGQLTELLRMSHFSLQERVVFGHTLVSMREVDAGARAFRAALADNPEFFPAREGMLRVALEQNDRSLQRETAHAMLEQQARHPMANLVLGNLRMQDGELDQALSFFRVAWDEAGSLDARNAIAYVLYLQGNYEESLALSTEVLSKVQENAAYWDTHAMALYGLGRFDEALDAQENAVSLAPANHEILFHLAKILRAKGDELGVREIVSGLREVRHEFSIQLQTDFDIFLREGPGGT